MGKARKQTNESRSVRIAKLRSRLASLRYGGGLRDTKIIAVTGHHGKSTVVKLIAELLRESGVSVVEMMAAPDAGHSFETDPFLLHRRLADISRQKYDYVVLEVHAALIASHIAPTLVIDTLVATSDSPELAALSAGQVRRSVLPHGLTAPDGVQYHNVMTFGTDPKADMKIVDTRLYRKGTEISFVIDQHTQLEIASYLIGHHNAANIAAALATVYVLGVDVSKFAEGVARVERVEGNYDYLDTGAPYTIAIDRGVSLESVRQLLESTRPIAKRRLIVAVDVPLTHEELAQVAESVDRLIAVGETAPVGVDTVKDHEEAALLAVRGARKDDAVLLVGRRFAAYTDDGRPTIEMIIGAWHE